MSKETTNLLFGLLTLGANAATVIVLIAVIGHGRVPALATLKDALAPIALPFAAIVATVTTLGSLSMSEIAPIYVPCRLCWFQRIAAYPLSVILIMAAIKRDLSVRRYVIAIAAIGAALSIWHLLVEQGVFDESSSCKASGPPCAIPWFKEFGYLTLAGMALSSFALIISLMFTTAKES